MRLALPKDGSFTLSDSSSTSAKVASQVERVFRGGCPTRYFPNTLSSISTLPASGGNTEEHDKIVLEQCRHQMEFERGQ